MLLEHIQYCVRVRVCVVGVLYTCTQRLQVYVYVHMHVHLHTHMHAHANARAPALRLRLSTKRIVCIDVCAHARVLAHTRTRALCFPGLT